MNFLKKSKKLSKMNFKKENYPFYIEWIEKSPEDVKDEIENFSKNEIINSFEKRISYSSQGLESQIGWGTNKVNLYTIENITQSINKYLSNKEINNVLVSVNKNGSDIDSKEILSFFNKGTLNISTIDDSEQPFGFFTYVLSLQKETVGIYVNIVDENVTLKLVNNDGKEFNSDQYFELNDFLQLEQVSFDKVEKLIEKEIKILKKENYYQSYKNFFGTNIHFKNDEKIIVVAQSDLAAEYIKEIFPYKNIEIVKSKKVVDNLSSPTAFKAGYKKANKQKITFMVTIDSTAKKISFAYKQNKTWTFATSFEVGYTLWKLANKPNYVTNLKIPNILKPNIDNETPFSFGIDYEHSLSIHFNDAFNTLSFLFKNLEKGSSHIVAAKKTLQEEIGFFYETENQQTISKEEFDSFIVNIAKYKKMNDIEVRSINLVSENSFTVTYKFVLDNSQAIFVYNKTVSKLETYYYTFDVEQMKAFYSRRELKPTFETFIHQRDDSNIVISKKGQKKLLFFLLVYLVGIFFVFTYVFNWQEIWTSITILLTSWNTFYPYILFFWLLVGPWVGVVITYVVLVQYKSDVKILDIYKILLLSSFIYMISPLPIIGFAFYLWYFRSKGYKTSEVIPVMAVTMIAGLLITVIYGVTLMPYGLVYLNNMGFSYVFFTILVVSGLLFQILASLFFPIMAYSTKVQTWMFYLIEKGLFFIGLEKIYARVHEEIDFNITNMAINKKLAMKNKMVFIFVLFMMFVGKSIFTWKTMMSINLISDVNIYDFFGVMATTHVIDLSLSFIPIPGGVGLQDWLFFQILLQITGNFDQSQQITFIWRFFTYYGFILVASVPFGMKMIKLNIQQRKKQVDIWRQV